MPLLDALLAYVPSDRRHAIASGTNLPSRAFGTALWADLSGFTPLSETLVRKFGPRHGADELGLYLNHFYNAIIAPVDMYSGSVVDFSGDAITCWFDDDDGQRAIAAAQTMQAAVQPFLNLQLTAGESISLGVKIAIASGPARRFCIGDPAIQYMDTLAGVIMDRLAGAGSLAETGEILLDESVEANLAEGQRIAEWRTDLDTRRRAAVLSLDSPFEPPPSIPLPHPTFDEEQIRPWLLPDVFEYIQNGQGEFLTELRPAAALFMRFDGLDYDDEQASDKLNEVTCAVQRILFEYEGVLLQVTIGDKGSYLYAAFGAPISHEDDVLRAATAALKLRNLPAQIPSLASVRIGLSYGVMRTGGYGGASRRTYGVLGEDANLAARLMEQAGSGQILASEAIWEETETDFHWQRLPAVQLKGRQYPIRPAILQGWMEQDMADLPEVTAALPMIGRQAELALIREKLELARQGYGQIVRITGEAGIGKSRLLAEVLEQTDDDEMTCYGNECESYGTHSAYLVWQPIWRAFFDVDPQLSLQQQIDHLEKKLAEINPDFLLRLPLLSASLNIPIPDNILTEGMDAKVRKTLHESLLVDCLRAWVGPAPLVLVLEDLHWIDPLSLDLLNVIGRAIKELPILLLLTYRPLIENHTVSLLPDLINADYLTHIELTELVPAEMKELIVSRWAGFGLRGVVSNALVERLSMRTQGNPFYMEELLNYFHGQGLDLRYDSTWAQADLPDSLHSLILGRIGQLTDRHRITIKAASILGRLFRASWLYECYPLLGSPIQVTADLDTLSRLELLVQEKPAAPLSYLFKHVITQEVAYQSLSYSTRARLHQQFASYIEDAFADDLQPYLDLLAYHYERSYNLPKKREFLRKAGEAAQKIYANEAAISYFSRALEFAPQDDHTERFEILLAREQIYGILRKLDAQQQDLATLSELANILNDDALRGQVALRQSNYLFFQGNYSESAMFAQRAIDFARQAGDVECEARCYIRWSDVLQQQGNMAEADTCIQQALVIAESINHQDLIAHSLCGIGMNITGQDAGCAYLQRALEIYRQNAMHHQNEPVVLFNLAERYVFQNLNTAYDYYQQALDCWRIMGDRRYESLALSRFANLIVEQRSDYATAQAYCEQALPLSIESFDRLGEMSTLFSFGYIALVQNNYLLTRSYAEQALKICREIGYSRYEGESLAKLGMVANQLGDYSQGTTYYDQAFSILRTMPLDELPQPLTECGSVYYHLRDYVTAKKYAKEALAIAREINGALEEVRALILLGHIFREMDDLDSAFEAHQAALDLATGLKLKHFARQAQTGLAAIALLRGNLPLAKAPLEEVLRSLETDPLSTVDEIFWVYLICYRILRATSDVRAWPILAAAHQLLQTIADEIDDPRLRKSFLENVICNREIIEIWEAETEKG